MVFMNTTFTRTSSIFTNLHSTLENFIVGILPPAPPPSSPPQPSIWVEIFELFSPNNMVKHGTLVRAFFCICRIIEMHCLIEICNWYTILRPIRSFHTSGCYLGIWGNVGIFGEQIIGVHRCTITPLEIFTR